MVTLIVTANEAYLGCIMYLALQMQLFIHLPRQVSLCIRPTRGGVYPFFWSSRGSHPALQHPMPTG